MTLSITMKCSVENSGMVEKKAMGYISMEKPYTKENLSIIKEKEKGN